MSLNAKRERASGKFVGSPLWLVPREKHYRLCLARLAMAEAKTKSLSSRLSA